MSGIRCRDRIENVLGDPEGQLVIPGVLDGGHHVDIILVVKPVIVAGDVDRADVNRSRRRSFLVHLVNYLTVDLAPRTFSKFVLLTHPQLYCLILYYKPSKQL